MFWISGNVGLGLKTKVREPGCTQDSVNFLHVV